MAEKDTIAIQLVREALLQSCAPGAATDEALTKVGIDPALLAADEGRVPASQYARLWRLLARRGDDEFFGMDPRPLKSGSLAFLCRSAMAQPTLAAALDTGLTFLSLMLEKLPAQLVHQQSLAEIVLLEDDAEPRRAFTYFTYWMIVHGVACWLAGRRIPILAIELRCAEPDFTDDYRVMFSENLRFERPRTRMIFSADCLDLPIKRSAEELKRFLARRRRTFWSSTATPTASPAGSSRICGKCPPSTGRKPRRWPSNCACPPRPYAGVWPRKGRPIRASRTVCAKSWQSPGWQSLRSVSSRLLHGWVLLMPVRSTKRFASGRGRTRGITAP